MKKISAIAIALALAFAATLVPAVAYADDSSPTIIIQPADKTVDKDEPTFFQTSAYGSGPIRYQWRYRTSETGTATNLTDGQDWYDTDKAVLKIYGRSAFNGYQFSCAISNESETVYTKWATLTIAGATTEYQIAASASPETGGTVSGAGTYEHGKSVTLIATPETGYSFINWTDAEGTPVSTDATYTFAAEGDRTLTANFKLLEYSVSVSYSPEEGADKWEADGGGTYLYGNEVMVRARAAEHYSFVNWTEDGKVVSTEANYTFTADRDRTLVANFELQAFTVKFVNWDGTELQSGKVAYGETPEYTGPEPTRKADEGNTYKFTGWTPAIAAVTGETTYTATYEATPIKKATLTFDLAGGTLDGKTGTITVEANVGDTIKLPAAPTREGYTFKCWKGSEYAAGADYKVEGDHAFTAEWEKDAKTIVPSTGDSLVGMLALLVALVAAAGLCLAFAGVALRRRGSAYSGKHARK